MWPNNGFGNGTPFHFNQDDFGSSPFGGSTGTPQRNGFAQHQQSQMQLEDFDGDAFAGNVFRPEIGLYNQEAFQQNSQFINPQQQNSPPQFNMAQPTTPTPPRPVTQINPRAAELKEQLMKRKEARGHSATPPVPSSVTKQPVQVEASRSRLGSPRTPMVGTESHTDALINDLISTYSDSKSKSSADTSVKKDASSAKSNTSNPHQLSASSNPSAKSLEPTLGSPTKVLNPGPNGRSSFPAMVKSDQNGHTSNGSISEGEILEDTPKKATPPTEARERQPPSKPTAVGNDQSRTTSQRPPNPSYSREPRDESPPRRTPPPSHPRSHSQRSYDERREEPPVRAEQRPYPPDRKNERKPSSELVREPVREPSQRRSSRDESYRRPEPNSVQRREEADQPKHHQKPAAVAEVVPLDDLMKEWLEITGYYNVPYREKILGRRRALAKLEEDRRKILADIAADERPNFLNVSAPQPLASSMLPPPIPNKVGPKTESTPLPMEVSDDLKRERDAPNKRSYSDVDDGRDERDKGYSGKIARTDDRNHGARARDERIKEEEQEHRRPRSSGFGSSRRSSIDPRDEIESPRHRYDEERSARRGGRGSSRDRDFSPGRRAYENRPPARYGPFGEDDMQSRDEHQERDKRKFEVVGGYRGRAYDPNYRGRGRGRGRGDFQSHLHFDSKPESSSFGSQLANSMPYRDKRGFDRGGKGDTRYFIVKSFNEENVLKCIADSVWTTQVQNGGLFKEAFETCKNVILVFSINKSKAFQGYARMESLPGTVEVPEWQRTINWESAGAFKVKWLVVCSTRFHRIGHLKNAYNENQAVLIGKDGQEIEENCGAGLIELIDEEARETLSSWRHTDDPSPWDEYRRDF